MQVAKYSKQEGLAKGIIIILYNFHMTSSQAALLGLIHLTRRKRGLYALNFSSFLHLPSHNPAPLRLWTTVDMLAGRRWVGSGEPEEARF